MKWHELAAQDASAEYAAQVMGCNRRTARGMLSQARRELTQQSVDRASLIGDVVARFLGSAPLDGGSRLPRKGGGRVPVMERMICA